MKKFFLIPLLACFSCVMAWGATVQVGDFAALKNAIDNASNGDVIELTADITYDGAWSTVSAADLNSATTVVDALCITKSITLDGKGHKIVGWGKHDIGIGSVNGKFHGLKKATLAKSTISDKSFGDVNTIHRVSLAIHPADANAAIDVVVKNLSLGNKTMNNRYYGIAAFDGVNSLEMDNVTIETNNYNNQQGLCVTGADATPVDLDIKNTTISTGNTAYCTYFLKPITGKFTNSTINGWCGLYFKYHNIPVYGAVVGSRGSNLTCDACEFNCPNVHDGHSNDFAIFPIEDDGITLTLNNCSMNAEQIGKQAQAVFSLQAMTRTSGYQPVRININGDNTHVYNIKQDSENTDTTAVWNAWAKGEGAYRDVVTGEAGGGGNGKAVNVSLDINITGGTFGMDPRMIKYPKYDGETWGETMTGVTIDWDTYEVKEVSQGGKNVYRVVKKAARDGEDKLYDLNDNVQSQGDGQNPNTSFELSNGTAMTLDQPTTKAGYVEVSNATTVTVANNQTLVINNGLDVQGTSAVTAKPGSALVIGEGGIVTQAPENIVIEANQNGAASLLLDPTITVNQTPELTVKMVAHNVGKIGEDYFWHRFALPVDKVRADDGSWSKDGHTYGTLLYKWDYTNNKWASLQELDEMKPFYGYTLSLEEIVANPDELKDAGYIFKGNLTGNVNSTLEFSRQGYNFFGNSYTGYISVLKLVDELIGNADIDGTVWMWNSEEQQYEDVPLNDLRNNPSRYTGPNQWKAEVAPMQTFILRLLTENTDATAEINYATAVWGNPRYNAVTGANNAPARQTVSTNDAYVRIVVTDANGKKDAVKFLEDANLSDAYEKGFDGAKYMNERTVNVYATVNGENYGTVATDNIEGKMLTICTTDEIAYTISFTDVEGNEYALRDNVTGKVIAIEEGATYEFAAQPNSTIEGRFEILPIAKMPTAIENTEVKANAKGIYTLTGQYLGEDFEAVPAGVYVVNGVKIVK